MKNREPSPLFHLCFHRELPAGRRYSVTAENTHGGKPCTQILEFFPDDYSIVYLHPHTPFTAHLQEHEGSLKKILSTSMKASRPEEISFPFTFSIAGPDRDCPVDHVSVYTDGSLSPSGNGGWAGICVSQDGTATELTGHERDSSSNRMELMAVVKLIEHLPDNPGPVVIYTDSRYVIRGARIWLRNWTRNGFITALNRPVKNQDLWKNIQSLINRGDIYFFWISSRSDNPYHVRCDALARETSLNQQ